ncbi:hypothetical protein ACFW91_37185 [Streptomyces asoensis]|uniref:hypothetical protein n=1 Tax=Streptomyces asoensis TaxID=249586 RepID=UPI003691AE46
MGQPKVTFDPVCGFDDETEGDVKDALLNVAVSSDAHASEQHCRDQGVWPADVQSVKVHGRLSGGRGGADVLKILVTRKNKASSLQAAKLMPYDEALKEWTAYQTLRETFDSNLYVPVVAVSKGVHANRGQEAPCSVVVYRHVSAWNHAPGELEALEDLVTAAVTSPAPADLESCLTTLSTVLDSLSANLYHTAQCELTDLEAENRELGDDLKVTVDKIEGTGARLRLVYGNPQPGQTFPRPTSSDVLRSSTSPPGSGRTLQVDERADFTLEGVVRKDGMVRGTFHGTQVQVELADSAMLPEQLKKVRAGQTVEVQGKLTSVRAERWSAFLRKHFGDGNGFTEDGSSRTLQFEGVTIDHPLGALHSLLVADAEPRMRTAVHGDLNPRNVILSGRVPYLIDSATFSPEGFTLADVTWLETCILRDAMAAHLSFADMVRLQRYLGLLTLLRPSWSESALASAVEVLEQATAEDNPTLARCLLILWRLRSGIWSVVPSECRAPWSRHYFQHVVLSACRTFKWDSLEEPERVRVTAAAAGVACGFLGTEGALSHWPRQDLDLAAQVLLCGDQSDPVTEGLLVQAAAAGDPALRNRVIKRLSTGSLREARRILHERFSAAGQSETADWGDDAYIDMEGRQLAPGEPHVRQGNGALTVQARDCLTLLTQSPVMMLIAEPGGGKSRIAREFRLRATATHDTDCPEALLPLHATAEQIMSFLQQRQGRERTVMKFLLQLADVAEALTERRLEQLVSLGVVHLTVDELHDVAEQDQRKILAWIRRLSSNQPRLRLLVCQRAGDFHPAVLKWPTVVVHKVRESAARAYATEVLRRRLPECWQDPLRELDNRLFADPAAGALRDWAGKPHPLRLLVHHLAKSGQVPANVGGLLRTYLERLLHTAAASAPLSNLLTVLGKLAEELGSAGSLSREQATAVLHRAMAGLDASSLDVEQMLQMLVHSSVIMESGERIRFRDPLLQAYCAAIALQQYPADQVPLVRERILRHGWRDTAVFLVADENTDPGCVLAVVTAGVEASPWYGALLLQAAPQRCTQEVHHAFLHQQQEVLRSPYSGAPAWKRSAYALAKYGVPSAQDVLVKIACLPQSPGEAAQAALDGLVMMHQWSVPGATPRLTDVVSTLLDPGKGARAEVGVTVRALRSIQVARLAELAGFAWAQVTPGRPWEVVSQAWQALRQLGLRPDRIRRRAYTAGCTSRLGAIDEALRTAADTGTADALNAERLQVLEELAAAGDVETLLKYRFRAGLAECPAWAEMLQQAVTTRRTGEGATSAVAALLDQSTLHAVGMDSARWKRLLVFGDEGVCAMAAHYILAARDVVSVELLSEVAAQRSARSLSVVAAFVHCLPPEGHKALEQLLEPFLTGMDAAMVEAVSSFVSAAETLNQDTGRRLALRVQHALAQQGLAQEALHWPWCTTWRRALPPRAEIPLFLGEQSRLRSWRSEGPDAALLSLVGSADVLLDAPYVKPMSLAPDLRRRLGDLKPSTADGPAAHQFVLLAASAGLPEELPFIRQVAGDEYNQQTVIRHAHGIHGLVEVTLAAHAVTAIGYLGMLAALDDPDLDAAAITGPLEEMGRDTGDMHPSMERARLVALGYWGQLAPLLGALCAREDPILASSVRNIVNHWLPGPRTSTGPDPYFTKVAESLSVEMSVKQLPSQTRALLTELRIGIEDRLGRYVI